jgi:hypothetical protein
VKPSVVQPDGILTLSFDKAITPVSITIGPGQIASSSAETTTLEVKVPKGTPLGRQDIAVMAKGVESPLTSSIIVAPLVLGLKARKDAPIEMSRVVVPRGEVILQFSESIPSEIRNQLVVKLRAAEQTQPVADQTQSTQRPSPTPPKEPQPIDYVIPENDYLILRMPAELDLTTYTVEVSVKDSGVILEKRPRLGVVYTSSVYWRATLNLLVPIIILYVFFRWLYKVPEGQPRYTFLGVLLLEPENQTFSLSRAQFLAWLVVIVWCYLFLYFSHGYVEQFWTYPKLGNSTYAFLISLGTLIGAQVTNKTRGTKGAGEVHPSVADLIVHGGVLALDRVQQAVWTLVAIGMFVRITVTSFGTATGLPDIPNDLLALMGLSSAGYLGGKMVRGAGPVIDQVTPRSGSVILNIRGKHISKDAFIWLDGVDQPKDKINIKASDPEDPKFVTEIELTLDTSIDQWYASEHVITVVNADAQRADWRSNPQILSVTAGAVAAGKAPLTITGAHLEKGATVEIGDAPNATPQQDRDNPNLFTATVEEAWLRAPHQITVTSGQQKAMYSYAPTAAGEGAADGEGVAGGGAAAGGEGAAGGGGAAGGEGAAGGGGAAGGEGAAGGGGAAGG